MKIYQIGDHPDSLLLVDEKLKERRAVYVVNGNWFLKISKSKDGSLTGKALLNQDDKGVDDDPPFKITYLGEAPKVSGDYNDIIEAFREQRKSSRNESERF